MPDFHLLCEILCALVLDKMIERVILQCILSVIPPLVVFIVNSSMKVDLWQSLKCILCP